MTKKQTCRERWYTEKQSRISDVRTLWHSYCRSEEEHAELGSIYNYGLAFDYVAPGTFLDQAQGYWRWQFSTGGPGDEVRYYSDGPEYRPHRVTYVFLGWFDGHERALRGRDEALMLELWDWFAEIGLVESAYEEAES